jgi:hypothetical protein
MMMKEREEREKSKLTIRLAEPVIYLKDVDFSGRHRTHNELSPPSLVRGILVLHLSKPTKISSIVVELTAKSSTRHPEGTLPRRYHHAPHLSDAGDFYLHSLFFGA